MVDANAVTDPIEPVVADDSPVVDSDEKLIQEFEAESEVTYYDTQDQENFTVDLLTAGASGQELYRQIHSDSFINENAEFTMDTISKARAFGLDDAEIAKHQQSLLKQMETQRNKIFDDAGYSKNRGFISEVISWAKSNFTVEEMNIFTTQTNENPTKSLNALDAYYLRIHNGEEER